MGFKSIFKAFRVSRKPGLRASFLTSATPDFARYTVNGNGDPLVDQLGVLWTRDGSAPLQYYNGVNDPGSTIASLSAQRQDVGLGVDLLYVGQDAGAGQPCAILKIAASIGDPAVAWATTPYYLQIHTPSNGVAPIAGAVPDFVIPVPRPNEGIGMAYFDFGVSTPFNCTNSGGGCIAFSTTPNTYTSPAPATGQINANWAFYALE